MHAFGGRRFSRRVRRTDRRGHGVPDKGPRGRHWGLLLPCSGRGRSAVVPGHLSARAIPALHDDRVRAPPGSAQGTTCWTRCWSGRIDAVFPSLRHKRFRGGTQDVWRRLVHAPK